MKWWFRIARYPEHYPEPPPEGDPVVCPPCAEAVEVPRWSPGTGATVVYGSAVDDEDVCRRCGAR